MQRHQRNKSKMFGAIERWQSSGVSQVQFCVQEGIPKSTFYYWHIKYKKEKGYLAVSKKRSHQDFIPIKVTQAKNNNISTASGIEISFPNGVQVNCPAGIDIQQLKTLINF